MAYPFHVLIQLFPKSNTQIVYDLSVGNNAAIGRLSVIDGVATPSNAYALNVLQADQPNTTAPAPPALSVTPLTWDKESQTFN